MSNSDSLAVDGQRKTKRGPYQKKMVLPEKDSAILQRLLEEFEKSKLNPVEVNPLDMPIPKPVFPEPEPLQGSRSGSKSKSVRQPPPPVESESESEESESEPEYEEPVKMPRASPKKAINFQQHKVPTIDTMAILNRLQQLEENMMRQKQEQAPKVTATPKRAIKRQPSFHESIEEEDEENYDDQVLIMTPQRKSMLKQVAEAEKKAKKQPSPAAPIVIRKPQPLTRPKRPPPPSEEDHENDGEQFQQQGSDNHKENPDRFSFL